jgi:hypothetical protein
MTIQANCVRTAVWTEADICVPGPCPVSGLDGRELAAVLGVRAAPNPFTGSVALWVSGPKGTAARILIFDAAGRLVRTAWNGTLTGHTFAVSWNGRDDSGREAPAGVYLVRAEGIPGRAVSRLVMIR